MFAPAKTLVVPLFGVFVLAASAMAQSAEQSAADQNADQSEATAAPTPLAASASTPPAIDDTTRPIDQAIQTPPDLGASPNLGQGTKAQAEHSAEATAHKSLNDPNNQKGTSTSGRTRPIVEANGTQTDPAAVPPQPGAQ